MTLLKQTLQQPDGSKAIFQHAHETLNANQVFQIRNKCVFLIQAYRIALEKMGINNTCGKKDCCQEAVILINEIGFNMTINANTLMNWNIDFRKQEKFHHPNIYVANYITSKPAMFKYFPQAAVYASLFILDHLNHFIVEMLRGELTNKIIPSLKVEVQESAIAATADMEGYNLLCNYNSKPPSLGWESCQHVGNMLPRQPTVGTFGQYLLVVATQN